MRASLPSILPLTPVLLLLLLLLPLPSAAADPCTLIVTARPGDTCASLAEISGITVSQFLRANPTITTCSSLVSGTRYCVDPNYIASSASSRAPAATGGGGGGGTAKPLDVTSDGQCGPGLTCLGSAFGDCCSEHGWCGSSSDHCGETCQGEYGRCNSSGGSTTARPTGGAGGVSTVFVTTTQIVRQTVPVTVPPVTITVKESNNGVATSTTTSTLVVTQSSLTLIRSTLTTIKTITITDAKQCTGRSVVVAEPTQIGGGGGTFVLIPRAGATGVGRDERRMIEEGERYPLPTQPGTVPDCQTFYRVKSEDSCEGILNRHAGAFGIEELYAWNQQLTGDCQGLWLGHWICVGV